MKRTQSIRRQLMIVAAIGGLWMLPTQARATEPVLEAEALELMSKKAESPEDHAKAAKQFRLRAEALEAKAAKHEENAKKMATGHNPMAQKWPAMVRNGQGREQQLAIQARRAAQECRVQAAKHINLAVEKQLAGNRQQKIVNRVSN
jgi:hypothetical protein